MALDRSDLKTLTGIADKKLAKLGIHLAYRIEPTKQGSSASDRGLPLRIDGRDATGFGAVKRGKLDLLLHELGHKFQYQMVPKSVQKSQEFVRLFGDVNKVYKRKPGVKNDHPAFVSKYSQAHPQEDFAEIFAIYASLNGDMEKIGAFLRKKDKGPMVYDQIRWLDNYINGS